MLPGRDIQPLQLFGLNNASATPVVAGATTIGIHNRGLAPCIIVFHVKLDDGTLTDREFTIQANSAYNFPWMQKTYPSFSYDCTGTTVDISIFR